MNKDKNKIILAINCFGICRELNKKRTEIKEMIEDKKFGDFNFDLLLTYNINAVIKSYSNQEMDFFNDFREFNLKLKNNEKLYNTIIDNNLINDIDYTFSFLIINLYMGYKLLLIDNMTSKYVDHISKESLSLIKDSANFIIDKYLEENNIETSKEDIISKFENNSTNMISEMLKLIG